MGTRATGEQGNNRNMRNGETRVTGEQRNRGNGRTKGTRGTGGTGEQREQG